DRNASAAKFKTFRATNPYAPTIDVAKFQKGNMSTQDTLATARSSTALPSCVTDAQFDEACSGLLLDSASGRLELIQRFRRESGYKVYVLSNSDPSLPGGA
ncbi:hypothetical protein BGZ92_000518, partial [Podila epicladia]